MNEALVATTVNAHERPPEDSHYATPEYAIRPLLTYIDPSWTVWECADTYDTSNISRLLREHGCKVISTGLPERDFLEVSGRDFVEDPVFMGQTPDIIITNPPYKLKDEFIDKCLYWHRRFNMRFALLLPINSLEGVRRGRMWGSLGSNFELLVLDRRSEFLGKSVYFNTSWFCAGVLPQQIIFKEMFKA